MLSDAEIEQGKLNTTYSLKRQEPMHQHNDCIRIAYEWLDAQVKTKGVTRKDRALKHIIEQWGGRYVSRSDVDVAASLHPDIHGEYPLFNISSRLTRPNKRRLNGVGQALTHSYTESDSLSNYKADEP